jgi:hypothetical protein
VLIALIAAGLIVAAWYDFNGPALRRRLWEDGFSGPAALGIAIGCVAIAAAVGLIFELLSDAFG